MDPFKNLVIDAIIGVGFPSLTIALSAEKSHMAYFINTHRGHMWRREKLEEQSLEHLQMMYEGLCEEREIQSGIRAPTNDERNDPQKWARDMPLDTSHAH